MPRKRYATGHQRARKAALRSWRPGDVCARCGLPTDPRAETLHLDHDEHGGYLGLSHKRCNEQAGGDKSAQLAGKRPRQRQCVVCGIPIKPARGRTSATVETCGKAGCVAELKRRRRSREGDGDPPEPTGRAW